MINHGRKISLPKGHRRAYRLAGWALMCVVLTLVFFYWQVSRPGTRVEGCPQGCAKATITEHGRPLRIISLNMLHGYPGFTFLDQRINLLAREIIRLDADIILLQEVPQRRGAGNSAELLAQMTGMNFLFLRANGSRLLLGFEEGEAILSRFPLKDANYTELKPQAAIVEHRMVLHAVALTPQGDLDLFVTHLTGKDPQINQGQAESLKSFVMERAGQTAVVAGDFNAKETSPQIQALNENWLDTFRLTHPSHPGLTCCAHELNGSASAGIVERIDYLFLVPNTGSAAKIIDAGLVFAEPIATDNGRLRVSDHSGVLLTLQLQAE